MLPSHRSPALSVRSPEEAGGEAGLVHRHWILAGLAGLGIEPAQELLAEARIPGDAVGIDDDVMRLDGLARQIIFGDDHAGAAAFRARQRLERVVPLRARAQIDAAEKVGHAAIDLHALVPALFHPALAAPKLRGGRNALVHVALHARQRDVDEIVGLVGRARHPLERVAAHAAQHRVLLLVGAGEACKPFRVRELGGEILGLAQLQVVFRRLLRGHVHAGRPVEIVSDRANAQ